MFPLLTIVGQISPDLTRVWAGDQSGSVEEQIVEAIKKAVGTDDPTLVQKAIDDNPQLRAQLAKDLAEIASEEAKERDRANAEVQRIEFERYRMDAEERDRIRAEEFHRQLLDFQDRQVARSMQTRLAEDRSPLAWVAPILAFVLVALIFYLLHGIMNARGEFVNKDVLNVVLGALVTAFTTVVSYYFGSSLSSSKRDAAIQSGRLTTNTNIATGNIAADPDDAAGRDDPRFSPTPTPPEPTRQTDVRSTPRWPSGSPPPGTYGLFRQKAPAVMRSLIRDLGLTDIQAAGILGNIGWECGGFKALEEVKPVMGGIGGLGWCQWTGTRRKEFEKWISERNLDPRDDHANYGFLLNELRGTQASSVSKLRDAQTIDSATNDFMNTFKKPNARYANLSNRLNLARLALQEYRRAFNGSSELINSQDKDPSVQLRESVSNVDLPSGVIPVSLANSLVQANVEFAQILSTMRSSSSLDNFKGNIIIFPFDAANRPLEVRHNSADAQNNKTAVLTIVSMPLQSCTLRVRITEKPIDAVTTVSERLDITDGHDAEIVTFFVVAQSDAISFKPDYLSIPFRPKTEDWIGSFVFIAPESEGGYSIRLEFSQKNRLVKVIAVTLAVESVAVTRAVES
jgi:Phage tail lysozyme